MAQGRSSLGSVKRRGDVWRVRIDLGRDPQSGKRLSKERSVRGSRREADAELARMLAEAGLSPHASSRMRVGEYLEEIYLPQARERLREDTVAGYERNVRLYLAPMLGRVALADLDAPMVEGMLRKIEKPGARKSAYKTLRQALRYARRRQLVQWVATDAIEEPKVPRYEPVVLDASQAAQVVAAFRGDVVEAAVLLALGCGLRRSEICGLDWEDVDLEEMCVSVHDPYVCVRGKGCRNGTKTPNSRRVVSLPESFARRLSEIRPRDACGPILPGDSDGRMHPDSLSHRYDEVCRRNSCRWTSLKNLRHSHATIMLEAGVDVVTVSRRLGHSSVSVTDRFYLRPRRAKDVAAASAFDSLGVA